MEPIILFRENGEHEEFRVCSSYMETVTIRSKCVNRLVIGRYSVLPHYNELVADLEYNGSRLINSYDQHQWVANFDYYQDLKQYTFESWTDREFPYSTYEGPFVVKGMTNSKKQDWDTMMFAMDRRVAIEVAGRLQKDELIGRQRIIYRKYTPLVTYEIGINGLPFTNEWRLFFLGEKLLGSGYYWSQAEDVTTPRLAKEGLAFAREVAKEASKHVNFFVLDIGEKQEGGWILIEVNEQMSGLSMIDPDEFYRNLAEAALDFG